MGALAPVLGVLSAVSGVAGTIMSVQGQLEAGREAKAKYQYEQKVDAQHITQSQPRMGR